MESRKRQIVKIISIHGPKKSSEIYDLLRLRWGMSNKKKIPKMKTVRGNLQDLRKEGKVVYLHGMDRWYLAPEEKPEVQPSCCGNKKPPLFWILFAALAVTITAVIISKFYT